MAFAQSKYAVVSTNELLGDVVRSGIQRLAVVGCPCHIHGIRKLQMAKLRPEVRRRVTVIIGLYCGTQFYFEGTRHILFEECAVKAMDEVQSLKYRDGDWPGHFIVETKDGRRMEIHRLHYLDHILVRDYRRDRCMMCLNWSSEISDLSVGDNFAPPQEGELPLVVASFILCTEAGERLLKGA